MLAHVLRGLVTGGTQLLTGVQPRWIGCAPTDAQRIYFANHTSHMDLALIWSVLPSQVRRKTRPIAAAEYWSDGPIRRYLIHHVLNGVLIGRENVSRQHNPLEAMCRAADEGFSLILFPEGTRGADTQVQPFRSGVFHLAQARPNLELVPVWVDNAYRVLPKGVALPIPLLCSVAFGKPTRLRPDEPKTEFLERLRQSLIDLGRS